VLERENRALRQRTVVLENMLTDIDKQVGAWGFGGRPGGCWKGAGLPHTRWAPARSAAAAPAVPLLLTLPD
jgi:hypothetical protein